MSHLKLVVDNTKQPKVEILKTIRKFDDEVISFEWCGGEYIEARLNFGDGAEAINVWDYDADRTIIPFTQLAMVQAIQEWIDDSGGIETVVSDLEDLEHFK